MAEPDELPPLTRFFGRLWPVVSSVDVGTAFRFRDEGVSSSSEIVIGVADPEAILLCVSVRVRGWWIPLELPVPLIVVGTECGGCCVVVAVERDLRDGRCTGAEEEAGVGFGFCAGV